jgi:hypothetical protein
VDLDFTEDVRALLGPAPPAGVRPRLRVRRRGEQYVVQVREWGGAMGHWVHDQRLLMIHDKKSAIAATASVSALSEESGGGCQRGGENAWDRGRYGAYRE